MTETSETPVVAPVEAVVEAPKAVPEAPKPSPASEKPVSPASDLRDIQALLANGIYPGNVAPAIVKAYQLLERMAIEIEKSVK